METSTTTASGASNASARKTLLTLPTEMRDKILGHVLIKKQPLSIFVHEAKNSNTHADQDDDSAGWYPDVVALWLVCKQLRAEARGVFFRSNAFNFQAGAPWDRNNLVRFLTRFALNEATLIRRISIEAIHNRRIQISLSVEAGKSATVQVFEEIYTRPTAGGSKKWADCTGRGAVAVSRLRAEVLKTLVAKGYHVNAEVLLLLFDKTQYALGHY